MCAYYESPSIFIQMSDSSTDSHPTRAGLEGWGLARRKSRSTSVLPSGTISRRCDRNRHGHRPRVPSRWIRRSSVSQAAGEGSHRRSSRKYRFPFSEEALSVVSPSASLFVPRSTEPHPRSNHFTVSAETSGTCSHQHFARFMADQIPTSLQERAIFLILAYAAFGHEDLFRRSPQVECRLSFCGRFSRFLLRPRVDFGERCRITRPLVNDKWLGRWVLSQQVPAQRLKLWLTSSFANTTRFGTRRIF